MTDLSLATFQQQNPRDWKQLIDSIFPEGLPTRARWEKLSEVHRVLNRLGAVSGAHYTFLASGGGLDLKGAQPNGQTGLSELALGSQPWLAKINNVTFESFGDEDNYHWCYFRIELETLPARSESSVSREGSYQYLTEISPGEYKSPNTWDERHEEGSELPVGARPVVLALKGSMVVFAKISVYNALSHSTAGVHDTLNSDAFRERIALMREEVLTHGRYTTVQQINNLLLHGSRDAVV